ncbi:MAG: hypothetical protein J6B53_04930, partial [Clostridia bacterium]|nr:hypothetical protein [Clostridia bacterium]
MQDSLKAPAAFGRKKRRYRSLSFKVTRSVAISCILLGMLILVISITMYALILKRDYEHVASNEAKQVAVSVRHATEYELLTGQILSAYASSTQSNPEYGNGESHQTLTEILQGRPYNTLKGMLEYYCSSADVSNVSVAAPDPQTRDLIVVVDAGGKVTQNPGERKNVSAAFLSAFHSWNKEGELLQYRFVQGDGMVCTVGVPVANEQGRIVAYLFVDMAMRDLLAELSKFAVSITLAILLVTALITWIHTRWMRKAVVDPINAIAGAAQTYVSDKRSGSKESDHFSKLGIHTGDEVENLSLTMADMESDLLEIEKELTTATAENERISTELDMARRIQAESLPNIFPPFPERKDFEIFASMHPAKEVGGDFYDFFLLDEDHLGLVIAD